MLPAGERLYAIGDIHGRLDLFKTLIAKIETDNAERGPAKTQIVLLGDLIDRGADSAGVVEHARCWNADFAEIEALLGNHEASLLAVLEGETRWLESWLGYGGRETLLSYGMPGDLLWRGSMPEIAEAVQTYVPDAHKAWLTDRPLSLRRGGYLFAHAGIRPGRKLDDQKPRTCSGSARNFSTARRITARLSSMATPSRRNPKTGTTGSASTPAPISATH